MIDSFTFILYFLNFLKSILRIYLVNNRSSISIYLKINVKIKRLSYSKCDK